MPHIWNDILVVTKDELSSWYKESSLKSLVQRFKNKPYGIKRVQTGGNGRQLLISYDSLPYEIQACIPDPRKINHILEKFYSEDGEARNFYSSYRFEDLSFLKTEHQEQYTVNASVLKAIILLRQARTIERLNKGGSVRGRKAQPERTELKPVSVTLWADALSFNEALQAKFSYQHTLPASEKHFKRVLNAFETQGYEALISKKHRNQNRRKVTTDIYQLLESLFAGTKLKPTLIDVYRKYEAFLNGDIELITSDGEVLQQGDYKKLSERTVATYLNKWQSKIATHAKRSANRQEYMGQFTPYHSMHKGKYASSIISVDDRQPPFKTPEGKRVWFYMAKDLASDVFTCWVHGESKEGIIIEFYRQMVRNYASWGLPLPLEIEAEMSLNSSHTETFLKPGVMFEHVRIEANRARSKRIERDNKELRYNYEKGEDGWIARPHAKLGSNQAGPVDPKPRYYNEIVEMALRNITKWNNQPHVKHKNMSRWAVFMQTQNPNLKPINYAGILPHLGHKVTTTVRLGIIKFNYCEHLIAIDGAIALGQKLITLMERLEGQEVTVYWLDTDDGLVLKAMVFIDSQLICEALPKPVYYRAKSEQTDEDHAARTIMSAYVSTIEAFGKRRKSNIEPVVILDNRQPEFNDFAMPGQKRWKPSNKEVELLPPMPRSEEAEIIEILSTERRFKKPLKDRL